jgi:putative glutamine amidotransferase
MNPPLIGVTTYIQNNKFGHPIIAAMERYVTVVSTAGGVPMLIPVGYDLSSVETAINRIDGILFTGGGDLLPAMQVSGPESSNIIEPDQRRDFLEFALLEKVIASGQPFLGICRGLQMVNVTLGGTLYTHLPDQFPSDIKHNRHSGTEREYLAHTVQLNEGTRLSHILQMENISVNSLHHQGILNLALSLKPSAIAQDGLVEGIELIDYKFGLAVQWHPEWLNDRLETIKLFKAFIDAAK